MHLNAHNASLPCQLPAAQQWHSLTDPPQPDWALAPGKVVSASSPQGRLDLSFKVNEPPSHSCRQDFKGRKKKRKKKNLFPNTGIIFSKQEPELKYETRAETCFSPSEH